MLFAVPEEKPDHRRQCRAKQKPENHADVVGPIFRGRPERDGEDVPERQQRQQDRESREELSIEICRVVAHGWRALK